MKGLQQIAKHLFNKIYRHLVLTVGSHDILTRACTHAPTTLCYARVVLVGSSVEWQFLSPTNPWCGTVIPGGFDSWWTSADIISHGSKLQKTYTKEVLAARQHPFCHSWLPLLDLGCRRSTLDSRTSFYPLHTQTYTQLLRPKGRSRWTAGKEQAPHHPSSFRSTVQKLSLGEGLSKPQRLAVP